MPVSREEARYRLRGIADDSLVEGGQPITHRFTFNWLALLKNEAALEDLSFPQSTTFYREQNYCDLRFFNSWPILSVMRRNT